MALPWRKLPERLNCDMSRAVSCVFHAPLSGRVLRKSAPSEMRCQTVTSTLAVVSTVWLAANALMALPMAMTVMRVAMIQLFKGVSLYCQGGR